MKTKTSSSTSLAIDIGNTRTKAAIFQNGELRQRWVWEKPSRSDFEQVAYNHQVAQVILSSTATVGEGLEAFFSENFRYLRLGTDTPLPIAMRYSTPHTLGKDRIAAAAGAFQEFPGQNCLVIDAGTCITADVLTAQGEYLGGNIAPGVEMRLRAMHEFTAKLPQVAFWREAVFERGPDFFIGHSTETALRNGGQLHAVLEMQALIALCRQHFRPLRVLLTGGDADFFASNLKTRIFARPNLVLTGLHKILQHNVQILEKL